MAEPFHRKLERTAIRFVIAIIAPGATPRIVSTIHVSSSTLRIADLQLSVSG
jgi:hypothetical protein